MTPRTLRDVTVDLAMFAGSPLPYAEFTNGDHKMIARLTHRGTLEVVVFQRGHRRAVGVQTWENATKEQWQQACDTAAEKGWRPSDPGVRR